MRRWCGAAAWFPLLIAPVMVALMLLVRPDRREELRPDVATPKPLREPSSAPLPTADTPVPATAPQASPARTAFDRLVEALRNGDREAAKRGLEALREELVPDPVPDGENAALFYAQAFEKWPKGLSDEEAELVGRLSEGRALTADERTRLEKALERGREALVLLHQAAAMPKCRFALDYSQGAAMEMPHISGMIRAARLLELEALLSEGRAAPAAAAGARLSEAVSEEPVLISQLVRGLCHELSASSLQKAFEGSLSSETLRPLLGSLSPERVRQGFERTLLFELYTGVKFVLEGGDPKMLGSDNAVIRRPDDPLTGPDLAHYAETLSEYAKLAGRPYYEAREGLEAIRRSRVDAAPWYAEVTRLAMPAMDRAVRRQASSEAMLGNGQLAAALRIYREERGSYPGSLEDLRSILPVLPRDPFTGRSYQYRREGSGFVVWSVGEDGSDGGGVSIESDVLFRSPR